MRKIIITTLALVVALGVAGTAFAATTTRTHVFSDVSNNEQAFYLDFLGSLRIFRGDTGAGGAARPNDTLTRSEFAAVVVRMLGKESLASMLATFTPAFADAASVPTWAVGAFNVLANLDVIRGDDSGALRPNDPVTGAEALAMLTRALGNDKGVTGMWPTNYMIWAYDNGLLPENADFASWKFIAANVPVTRAQMAMLTYNALFARRGYDAKDRQFKLAPLADSFFVEGAVLTGFNLAESKATFNPVVDLGAIVTLYGATTFDALMYRAVDYAKDPAGKIVWLGTASGNVVSGLFKEFTREGSPAKDYIVLKSGQKVLYTPYSAGPPVVTGTAFRVNGGDVRNSTQLAGKLVEGDKVTIVLDDTGKATFVTVLHEQGPAYIKVDPTADTVSTDDIVGRVNLDGDYVKTALIIKESTTITGAAGAFSGLKKNDVVYVALVDAEGSVAFSIEVVRRTRVGIVEDTARNYPGPTVTVEFKSGSDLALAGQGTAATGYWSGDSSWGVKGQEWTYVLDRDGKGRLGWRSAGAVTEYPIVKIIGYQDRTKDRITVEDYAGNTYTFNVGYSTHPDLAPTYVFGSADIGKAGELRLAGRTEAEKSTTDQVEIGDVIGFGPFVTSNDGSPPPAPHEWIYEVYSVNAATGELTLGNSGFYQFLVNPQVLVYKFGYDEDYDGDGWLWPLGARVGLSGLKAGDMVAAVMFDPTGDAPEKYYLILKYWDNDTPANGLEDDLVWPVYEE